VPTNDEDRLLEVLDDAECRRLLGTVRVGRLGFTHGALPAILPVPFTVQDDCVRIPAREGNWVVDAVRRSVVAFAVDSYDVVHRTGWGVTVVGPALWMPGAVPVAPSTGSHDAPGLPLPGHSILVQMGLVRGWRMSLPAGTTPALTDTGAGFGTGAG
jgi:hypothetical protein